MRQGRVMTTVKAPLETGTDLADGAQIPLIGFGTWQLRGDEAQQSVSWALEAGYRHVDTATMYGNEARVGAAVRDSGLGREEVFLTTKLPAEHAGRERQTIERSLRNLGTDYVDLWLVHWPPGGLAAPEVWRELVRARDDGLTRAIGVSNYSLEQVDELTHVVGFAPQVNQIRWSPFLFDRDRLDGHRSRGVVLEGYSPFRAADLGNEILKGIATTHDATPAQVVVRWHLQREIVVIPRSARRERIVDNVDVGGFELSADEMSALDALRG
jgi:2,5-diketo-D-gluconate reductase A